MEEIRNNHLGCIKLVNNRITYQPQLVIAGFLPSTVGTVNTPHMVRLKKKSGNSSWIYCTSITHGLNNRLFIGIPGFLKRFRKKHSWGFRMVRSWSTPELFSGKKCSQARIVLEDHLHF